MLAYDSSNSVEFSNYSFKIVKKLNHDNQNKSYGIYHVQCQQKDYTLIIKLLKTTQSIEDFTFFSKLEHSNIQKYFLRWQVMQSEHIIAEHYETNLKSFFDNNQITDKNIRHLLSSMINGLKYLHSHFIVHGNLKMENIFLKNIQIRDTQNFQEVFQIGNYDLNKQSSENFNENQIKDVKALAYIIYQLLTKHELPQQQYKEEFTRQRQLFLRNSFNIQLQSLFDLIRNILIDNSEVTLDQLRDVLTQIAQVHNGRQQNNIQNNIQAQQNGNDQNNDIIQLRQEIQVLQKNNNEYLERIEKIQQCNLVLSSDNQRFREGIQVQNNTIAQLEKKKSKLETEKSQLIQKNNQLTLDNDNIQHANSLQFQSIMNKDIEIKTQIQNIEKLNKEKQQLENALKNQALEQHNYKILEQKQNETQITIKNFTSQQNIYKQHQVEFKEELKKLKDLLQNYQNPSQVRQQ